LELIPDASIASLQRHIQYLFNYTLGAVVPQFAY